VPGNLTYELETAKKPDQVARKKIKAGKETSAKNGGRKRQGFAQGSVIDSGFPATGMQEIDE
jgi:hypothetical protein